MAGSFYKIKGPKPTFRRVSIPKGMKGGKKGGCLGVVLLFVVIVACIVKVAA